MVDKRYEIITALKASKGTPVSGADLAEKLGISRTMVWKYINSIKENGYEIDSSPNKGYILRSVPQLLYPDEIRSGLKTTLLGKDIKYFDEAVSTNNIAKEIAATSNEGTIVIAEQQRSGRGRLGREWVSPRGGIWFSLILKPKTPVKNASRITLIAGLAVAKTIRNLGIEASIKWPNDVLVNGKKVCGILTEIEAELDQIAYVVVGIGINVNFELKDIPSEFQETTTTVKQEMGHYIDRLQFIQDLLFELEQQYIKFSTQSFNSILSEWVAMSDTIGKEVKVTTPNKIIEGKAIGITPDGALIVKKNDGSRQEIIAGQCIYSRPVQ